MAAQPNCRSACRRNVNENRAGGEIGLWIEATRGNNDGILQAERRQPRNKIRRLAGRTDMSFAQKQAPAIDLADQNCIRWAMRDDAATLTPREMVFSILDSFGNAKSELVMLF